MYQSRLQVSSPLHLHSAAHKGTLLCLRGGFSTFLFRSTSSSFFAMRDKASVTRVSMVGRIGPINHVPPTRLPYLAEHQPRLGRVDDVVDVPAEGPRSEVDAIRKKCEIDTDTRHPPPPVPLTHAHTRTRAAPRAWGWRSAPCRRRCWPPRPSRGR